MTDKRAFEAKLDAYGDACYRREHSASARAAVLAAYEAAAGSDRPCTCHPDDKPPVPCPKKYALTECRDAAAGREGQPVAWGSGDGHWVRAVDLPDRPDKARFTEPFYTHPAPKADAAADWVCVKADTVAWLLGEGDDFECPPEQYFRGKPTPYFWRKRLRESLAASPARVGEGE